VNYSDEAIDQHGDDTLFTLDTQIYNLLLDSKKSGNRLLKHFKIEYPEEYPQTYINSINVGRTYTYPNHELTTFDNNAYEVTVEIVITTKNYKTMQRREVLKTACYEVIKLIENSVLQGFCHVESNSFEYDNTNVIANARIVIKGIERFSREAEEKEYSRICRLLEDIELKNFNEGV